MGQQAKSLDFDNPFHHPVIISVICNVFFQKPSSIGNMHPEFFVSTHDSRSEPELPDSMVALAATAVRGSFCTQQVLLT
jgi:hypothetical protein